MPRQVTPQVGRLLRGLGGDGSDQVAVSLNDLARCVQSRGRLAEAESLLTESVAIVTARLGPEAMNTNFVYSTLGRLHREQGQYAKSVRELREARTHLDKILGAGSPSMAWLNCELAASLGSEGPSREADSLFAALANPANPPLSPADLVRFHVAYGTYLSKIGRYAEAETYLLLAEQDLRDPREYNVRRRLAVLETLVELEQAWGTHAPSVARAAALERWTTALEVEGPELRAAIAEGRRPVLNSAERSTGAPQ